MAGDSVALRSVADMTDVEMSGEENIDAGRSQLLHRHRRAPHQMFVSMCWREIERVVADHDPSHPGRGRSQARRRAGNLGVIEPATAMEWNGSRTVQSHRNHLIVFEDRFEILVDMAAIAAKRIEQAGREVEQRYVVVAWDHQHRKHKAIEKAASLSELAVTRPLCEIARDSDEIGSDALDGLDQRRDEPGIDATEMNIGEMDDRSHVIRPGAPSPAAPADVYET